MTKEQYKSKVEELHDRIYTIRKEITEVTKQYLATCPYQIGDKVKVKHGVNTSTVYVLKIEAPVLESEEYRYTFAAPKMDGTMSNKSAGIRGTIIEKL